MQNKCQNFDVNSFKVKEPYKNLTKYFISNKYKILKSDKIIRIAYKYLYFNKFFSISFFRRSCIKSTKCNSVFRFFKMSRYLCKYYASNGFFVGLSKASF